MLVVVCCMLDLLFLGLVAGGFCMRVGGLVW